MRDSSSVAPLPTSAVDATTAEPTHARARPARARKRQPERQVEKLLKTVFGLSMLRPGQAEVIEAVLAGRHTLAIMPTGAGKSLCYQLPALLKPGMTVVVSPLLALIRDQFDKMSGLGLEAVQVNSAVAADEVHHARAKIGRRSVEFVFTTPEQFASPAMQALLRRGRVDLVVIDEAHCVSHWGHDFRPAYLEAMSSIAALGTPTVLALTATAPPAVVEDIVRQLRLGPLHVVNTGADRPNLSYQVRQVENDTDKQRQLLTALRSIDGAVIVYAATVRHVEELEGLLRQDGISVVKYHGRMRASDRTRAQEAFMSGRVPVIAATNAFGMGIDRPDVRAVIHYDLPASLEVYAQESGRAGRDGEPAECILLFQRGDRRLQAFFMAGRYPTLDDFTALVEGLKPVADGVLLSAETMRQAVPALSASKLRVMLAELKRAGLVRERRQAGIDVRPDLFTTPLEPLAKGYEERRQRDADKLEQMIVYGQTAQCRTRRLLAALGEEPAWERCERCDNCRGTAARAVAAAGGIAV